MMVKQTRIIFDLNDIEAVRLQCSHCGGEIVNSVVEVEITSACPQCGKKWEPVEPNGYRGKNWELLRVLKEIIASTLPMRVRFEIDHQDQSSEPTGRTSGPPG